MGHAQAVVHALSVLQAEHLLTHGLPSSRLSPHVGGMKSRKMKVLPSDGVHLLPDDPVHLGPDPLPQGQHGIVPGGKLSDEPSPEKEAVAGRLRMGGIVPQGGYEQCGPAHPQKRYRIGHRFGAPDLLRRCGNRDPAKDIKLGRG